MTKWAAMAFLWAALCSMVTLAVSGGSDGSLFGGVCLLVLGWGAMGLGAWFALSRQAGREARWAVQHAEMLVAAGVDAGAGFDHSEAGAGIALNPDEQLVVLRMGGVYKPYGYGDIRACSTHCNAADAASRDSAAGADGRAAKGAQAAAGLLVNVRDMDCPTWKVAMADAGLRKRWLELLREELDGGGVAV